MAVTDEDAKGLSTSQSNEDDTAKEQQHLQQRQSDGDEADQTPATAASALDETNQDAEEAREGTRRIQPESTRSENSVDDDDEFGGDELLAQLLGGRNTGGGMMGQLNLKEAEKTWENLDSVHTTNSSFQTAEPGSSWDDFNESAASFASFGGGCSDSSLDDSGICEMKDTFQQIDDNTAPKPKRLLSAAPPVRIQRFPMGRSVSARHMMQRGASFRGSLDTLKENSLH